jgi:hypothetical protein
LTIAARTIACVPSPGTVRVAGSCVLVMVALASFASTAPAATDSGQPSAADQYVEQIPTIDGGVPLEPGGGGGGGSSGGGSGGGGGGRAGTVPLSPFALRELRALGGPTAKALRTLATSPALGAPRRAGAARTLGGGSSAASGAALSSTSSDSATTGVLVWLAIALLATTVIGVAFANHDRRQRRTSP